MRLWIIAMLFCLAQVGVGAREAAAPVERTWKIDGIERKALVCIPDAAATTKSPLIFAFHGHGGTMRYAARNFGYHRLWPEAIVVYMQGLPTPGQLTDPLGLKPGWQRTEGDQNDRDLKFFDAVLASLKKENKVDEKRVFVTGHSNGGGFTYVLWAARGDVFAAAAPAAAIAGRNFARLKPKPVLTVAGENDALVRFAWQERNMNQLRKLNGCEETGKPWAKSGALIGTAYASKGGTPFVSVIYPGPHNLPAEAPELIVKFFKEQGGVKSGERAVP